MIQDSIFQRTFLLHPLEGIMILMHSRLLELEGMQKRSQGGILFMIIFICPKYIFQYFCIWIILIYCQLKYLPSNYNADLSVFFSLNMQL